MGLKDKAAKARQELDAWDALWLEKTQAARLPDKVTSQTATTALALMVELKGKLPSEEGLDGEDTSLSKDAVEALIRLGYDRRQSSDAVRKARRDLGNGASVEEVIRRSLANV